MIGNYRGRPLRLRERHTGSRSRGSAPLRRWGALRTEPPLRIPDAPSPVLIRTGSPVIVSYRGRPCLRMKFYPWVSCLRRHNRTPLAGECPSAARGALRTEPPLRVSGTHSRSLSLRGREYRWLGTGFPSRGSLPQSGVYEAGLGLSFVRSLPEFGVGRVSQVKNGWRIRSGTANTPPKHTTLHKTMQSARDQPSRKVPVTSIAHHGRRRQKNGSL